MTTGPPSGAEAGRAHWWSPAPAPRLAARISARRAYGEALGVYLAFFGASVIIAVGTQAGFDLTNPEGWWITGSDGFDQLARAALAVAVVVLLAARRGVGLAGLGLIGARAKGGPGLRQGIRIAAWAALAFLVGGIVTNALATGHFPFGHASNANTVLELAAALNAGIVEEAVVLAFLVTTLEQAGRPRAEIAVVALACRGAYHIYYGPGAVGVLLWAGVFLWLFWRCRSVVPIMITHVIWDVMAFLSQRSRSVGGILVLLLLALFVTAFVLWLVDRAETAVRGPEWDRGRPPWEAGAWAGCEAPGGAKPPGPGPGPRPVDGPGGWGPPAGSRAKDQ